MSLPKKHRLTIQRQSISQLRKKGNYTATPLLSAYYSLGESQYSRFGIIIGAQISKKAVERNRLRRLIQAAIVNHLPKQNVDMVLFPKKHMAEMKSEAVTQEVIQLLQKIR